MTIRLSEHNAHYQTEAFTIADLGILWFKISA